MEEKEITAWQCSKCGSMYLSKDSAEQCCEEPDYYCEKCGKRAERYMVYCPDCRWEKAGIDENFDFPLYSDKLDKWYFDEQELEINALDDPETDYSLEELHLFCCSEIRPEPFDIRDFIGDGYLREIETPQDVDDIVSSKELDEAENDVNDILNAMPSGYEINWNKRPKISNLKHLYHPDSQHFDDSTKTENNRR